jgi:thioredoxin 1
MFYGEWYPFCKRFRPALKSAKSKYRKLGALVNEEENPLWDRFSINAVPIVIAFDDKGKIRARRDGRLGVDVSKADLDSMLKALE